MELRLFLASPGDVLTERERLSAVVEELNRTICPQLGFQLRLLKWETDTFPDLGRPQGVISKQIGQYDVMIGIMWKRFGTPTGRAESGTKEEFDAAYALWKLHGSPRILFYFSRAPYVIRSIEEVEQLRKVLEFKSDLQKHGLVAEYFNPDEFEKKVREHLIKLLYNMRAEETRSNEVDMVRFKVATATEVKYLFKETFLSRMLEHAAMFINISMPDVLDRLLSREELGSTGIGMGMALPHTYGNTHSRHILIIARSNIPVEWHSVDDEPVYFTFATIFCHGRNPTTLMLLSAITSAAGRILKHLSTKDFSAISLVQICETIRTEISKNGKWRIVNEFDLPDLLLDKSVI